MIQTFGGFFFSNNMADDRKKLEQERAELNTLINKGVSFEVKDTEFDIETRFFGLVKRYKPREVTRTFKIEELTSLFARKIKPSVLYKLYVLVNAMCNLGDFMNSIRLIQSERTTMPIRIEESNEG